MSDLTPPPPAQDGDAEQTAPGESKQTRARMSRFNWDLLDERIANDISLLTEVQIPVLSSRHPESEHWVGNYFLNSTLRGGFTTPLREYVFTYLRRITSAFEEYELAKSKTETFVETRASQPASVYMSALHHWEQCVAAAWQSIEAWMKMADDKAFKKGEKEASNEEKLHHIYNRSKHTDNAIKAGQMPKSGPLAVWITNDGLRSVDHLLTWTELVSVLDDLAGWADKIQDPKTIADQ